jgi:hypothetical protein
MVNNTECGFMSAVIDRNGKCLGFGGNCMGKQRDGNTVNHELFLVEITDTIY